MVKIRSKITGLFIFIAIFSAVSVAGLAIWHSRKIVKKEALQKMLSQTQNFSKGFDMDLQKLGSISNGIESIVLSSYPAEGLNQKSIEKFKQGLESQFRMFAKKMQALSVWIVFNPELITGPHSVSFFDQNRDLEFEQEEAYDIRDMDLSSPSMNWWTDAISYGETWTKPYYWENWDMELISYSKAIYIDSVFIGCLGSDFDFSDLREYWGNVKFYNSGYLTLMNEDLNFLIHPSYQGHNLASVIDSASFANYKRQAEEKSNGIIHYIYQNQEKVLTYQKLSNGWLLFGVAPLDEIFGAVDDVVDALLFILLTVVIFSVLLAALISTRITSPIIALVTLFNKAERGNLKVRSKIHTNDELQYLGERFNFFMSEIQRMIQRLKDQEIDLKNEKERAEESDRLKSAFLGNLSHEIRTPLYGIVGYSQLLNEGGFNDEERTKFVDIINKNNDKLLKFIDDILIFSKLEQGLLQCNKVSVSLNDFFQILLNEVRINGIKVYSKIQFVIEEIPIFEDEKIQTDQQVILQVLHILLDNAYKYTLDGQIVFGCIVKHDKWGFYVKDSGIGIPVEYQNLIFDKFYKYEHNSPNLYEGIGMGLSIAMDLVNLLNGAIQVDSDLNQGSIFTVTFPK